MCATSTNPASVSPFHIVPYGLTLALRTRSSIRPNTGFLCTPHPNMWVLLLLLTSLHCVCGSDTVTSTPSSPPYVIPQYAASTYAGNGDWSYSVYKPATLASFSNPLGLLVTPTGLYIAASSNQRVLFVDSASGFVSPVVGTGSQPSDPYTASGVGDNGPALYSKLSYPSSLALDSNGNLYISESQGHRVRCVIAATGNIQTVAGTGGAGYFGDGGAATLAQLAGPNGIAIDASSSVLYIADSFNGRVRAVNATSRAIRTVAGSYNSGFSGDGGLATNASLSFPVSVAISSGVLFIADYENSRIRAVRLSTGIISTFAGTTPSPDVQWYSEAVNGDGFLAVDSHINPVVIAVDPRGNVWVCDASRKVRVISAATGIISLVAGDELGLSYSVVDGVLATHTSLGGASGIAFDSLGNVFISEQYSNRVRKLSPMATGTPARTSSPSRTISPTASTSPGTRVPVPSPTSTASFTPLPQYIVTTVAGNAYSNFVAGMAATSTSFQAPVGLLVAPTGLYIAAYYTNRVLFVDGATGNVSSVVGTGSQPSDLSSSGLGDNGPASSAKLFYPSNIAMDSLGNLYICRH